MKQIRQYIRKILKESYQDIASIGLRIRIKILKPTDPSMLDILTEIRGLQNVITVRQEGLLMSASGGLQMADLIIGFEDDENFDVPDLKRSIWKIKGVDMVIIKTYNDEQYRLPGSSQ